MAGTRLSGGSGIGGVLTSIDRSLIGGGWTAGGTNEVRSPQGIVSQSMLVSTGGVLEDLYVYIGAALGNDITFTVRVNGVATALAATITAGNQAASDVVDEVVVSPGDRVDIQQTGAGTPLVSVGFQWRKA